MPMPLRLAFGVRGTVVGHRLGSLEGGTPPGSNASLRGPSPLPPLLTLPRRFPPPPPHPLRSTSARRPLCVPPRPLQSRPLPRAVPDHQRSLPVPRGVRHDGDRDRLRVGGGRAHGGGGPGADDADRGLQAGQSGMAGAGGPRLRVRRPVGLPHCVPPPAPPTHTQIGVRCVVGGAARTPPPLCISYALVQATVGVGTVLIWDLILIRYQT